MRERTLASRFAEEINGVGVASGAAGIVASLLIGVVIGSFCGTVGLLNVALGYSSWSWSPLP